MKNKLLLVLGMAAVSALSVNTTVAYLQDSKEVTTTMTTGSVKIEQLEYERVVDEDGNWIQLTGEENKDAYGYYPDKLQEFTQDKPLYPAVFKEGTTKWDDRNGSQETSGPTSHGQSWAQVDGAPGWNQLFDNSMKYVIDKFVFVKNTGDSDAYVRTWFAFEQGSLTYEQHDKLIGVNMNTGFWTWSDFVGDVEINGNKYVIASATYTGSIGMLVPNEIARPSLLQVYLAPEAGNDDVEALDGNNNGKFDVKVISQAVQTAGFDNATEALNAAFGAEHPFN